MGDLKNLFEKMLNNDPTILDQHGQWSSNLDTFGGEEPENTSGVWSWDQTHVIIGTCADDLEIVARDDLTPYLEPLAM